MTRFFQILFLMLVALICGCATRFPKGADALSATEAAIRVHLSDAHDAKVLFVAFGSDSRGKPIDPPQGFVSRFSDLRKPVKPASAADYNEHLVGSQLSGIRDIATGQRGWLFSAKVVRHPRPNSFEIELDSSGGGLSGGRFRVTVTQHADGRWHQEQSRVTRIY
jgi:hypothetical protein